MQVLDFARSTMTFRIDLDTIPPRTLSHVPPYPMNNARAQLDCRCTIADQATGRVSTFYLGANCKTEQVGAPRDLWLEPNADFIPIFSDDSFLGIKTFARADMRAAAMADGSPPQPARQTTPIATSFERVHLDLVEREAEPLTTPTAIVDAVLANALIVGEHRIVTPRFTATIEYPVKIINANERVTVFQTDTGPLLFPDLDRDPEDLLLGLELAFSATNAFDWAELIVRVPTAVADHVEVYHYARTVRLDAIENAFHRIAPDAPATSRRVALPTTAMAPEGGTA